MSKNIIISFMTTFVFFPSLALCGTYSYECIVKNDLTLEQDGQFSNKQKIYLGNKFSVDKATGVVLGEGLGNSSYMTKTVIDPGSSNSAYKLIWISYPLARDPSGRNTVYLEIKEYEESIEKPFVAIAGSNVLSGVCR